jgi:hypothetical protein
MLELLILVNTKCYTVVSGWHFRMLIRLILSNVSLIDLTFSKLALLRIETLLKLQESSLFYCTLPCLMMSIGQKVILIHTNMKAKNRERTRKLLCWMNHTSHKIT